MCLYISHSLFFRKLGKKRSCLQYLEFPRDGTKARQSKGAPHSIHSCEQSTEAGWDDGVGSVGGQDPSVVFQNHIDWVLHCNLHQWKVWLFCGTVGADEGRKLCSLLQILTHFDMDSQPMTVPACYDRTLRMGLAQWWKYRLLKSHLAPVEFPRRNWAIIHSVTTSVAVKHYGSFTVQLLSDFCQNCRINDKPHGGHDGSKPMTHFQQQMVPLRHYAHRNV